MPSSWYYAQDASVWFSTRDLGLLGSSLFAAFELLPFRSLSLGVHLTDMGATTVAAIGVDVLRMRILRASIGTEAGTLAAACV